MMSIIQWPTFDHAALQKVDWLQKEDVVGRSHWKNTKSIVQTMELDGAIFLIVCLKKMPCAVNPDRLHKNTTDRKEGRR